MYILVKSLTYASAIVFAICMIGASVSGHAYAELTDEVKIGALVPVTCDASSAHGNDIRITISLAEED